MDDRFAIGMAQLVLASCVGTVMAVTPASEFGLYAMSILAIVCIWTATRAAVSLIEWCEETGYKPSDYRNILFSGLCMSCMGIQGGIQAMHDYTYGIISVALLAIGAVFIAGGIHEQ